MFYQISAELFLALGLFVAIVSILGVRWVAKKTNCYSTQDFRRQEDPIPLLGGLGVWLSLITILGASELLLSQNNWPIVLGSVSLIICGVYDDYKELSSRWKFLAQLIATLTFIYFVPKESLVLVQAGLGVRTAVLLHGLWILFLVNATNMIDGMDGVAASFGIIASAFFYFMDPQPIYLIFASAMTGFLFFNWPNAMIYLGDSGSNFVGFFLATAASTVTISPYPSAIFAILLLVAHPQIDAALAMIRRLMARSSPFTGDQDHLHHKLKKIGLGKTSALVVFIAINSFAAFSAITIFKLRGAPTLFNVLFISVAALLAVLTVVYYLEHRLGLLMSKVGRSIIDQHLKMANNPTIEKDEFFATIYDLFPYYKVLQEKGIGEVHSFIVGFRKYIETNHPDSDLTSGGVYTVLVLSKNPHNKAQLMENYFALLESKNVKRNDSGAPWGMQFYSHLENSEEFIKRFGSYLKVNEGSLYEDVA